MNKELKIKYKEDFELMSEFVNLFDPCGLVEIGAPKDEYEYLVNHILSFTYDKKSREETRKMIVHEIENYYGCIDLKVLEEQYQTKFYYDLDELLNRIEQRFC